MKNGLTWLVDWKSRAPKKLKDSCIEPSWSWASVNAGVTHSMSYDQEFPEERELPDSKRFAEAFEILNAHLKPLNCNNPFGRTTDGKLVVQGQLGSAMVLSYAPDDDVPASDPEQVQEFVGQSLQMA